MVQITAKNMLPVAIAFVFLVLAMNVQASHRLGNYVVYCNGVKSIGGCAGTE